MMSTWSSLIEEIVHVAAAVGQSNARGPKRGSPYASEVDEIRAHATIPDGALQQVAQDSLGYLSAAGRHCLAISKLLAAHEVFVSLLPLLRAQLETYGRIAWFLEPFDAEGGPVRPSRRVARHHMDALASLCRRRFSASKRRASADSIRELKRARNDLRNRMLELFPGAQLTWSNPGDELDWRCDGDGFQGLGDGAAIFDRVVRARAQGHYDSLSDFSHPSLVTIRALMVRRETDDYVTFDWRIDPGEVAIQAWNCGAMHAQATKLIAEWFGLPLIDEIDELLDRFAAATGIDQ